MTCDHREAKWREPILIPLHELPNHPHRGKWRVLGDCPACGACVILVAETTEAGHDWCEYRSVVGGEIECSALREMMHDSPGAEILCNWSHVNAGVCPNKHARTWREREAVIEDA